MDVRIFEELTTPDQRTRAFTPLGLSTMGLLKRQDAADFQKQVIAHCDLANEVTEGTRNMARCYGSEGSAENLRK
jgi:hypothetical protein